MNAQPGPPVVLTKARVQRIEALYPAGPFSTGCPHCGLHAALQRICAGGRSVTVRCRFCGARTFAQHPRQLFAPSSVMDLVGERGVDHLIRFMARLEHWGQRRLQQVPWEPAAVSGRTVQQLAAGQACLSCGEPETLTVRRDRHGRPYGSCAACAARTFWRHSGGLVAAVGWTVWLRQPGHEAAWWDAFQLGKQRWGGWLAPLQDSATSENSQTTTTPRQETA